MSIDHRIKERDPALFSAPQQQAKSLLSRLRARWRLGLVLLVGAIAVYFLVHWLSPRPQGQPGGRFGGGPMAVAIAKAEKGDIRVTLNALGTVTPLATVTVVTQISGQLQKIGFQEGQIVHQGDFLAQIDPRPYEAMLETAKGTLARDRAQLAGAKVDLERYRKLVEEKSLATQTLDTQVALVGQLEGTVTGDQGAVDTANLDLTYCHIVSPITGRIGLRQVDPGNYVAASSSSGTGIAVVTQTAPISVIAPIPEDSLPQVMTRINAGATLEVTAFNKDNSVALATGKFSNLDNEIDPTTGTVKLRALFDNTDGLLFPNQFVNLQVLVDTLHDQIVVPTSAIETGVPGTFVYIVNADSTVSVKPVKLGAVDGTRQAIASGLEAGEIVVTEGVDRLRDGAFVTVPGRPPGAGRPGNRPRGKRGPGMMGPNGARPPGGG